MSSIKTVLGGAQWAVFSSFTTTIIKFITIPILARILTPDEFGVVAIALSIIMLISLLGGKSGFSSSLIFLKDCNEKTWGTALFTNFLIGLICSFLLLIFSDDIAAYFENPSISVVLKVLSFVIPIQFICDIFVARLNKGMEFKKESIIITISELIAVIVALAIAFNGGGVWALIAQHVASNVLRFVLLFNVVSFNDFRFSLEEFKKMYKFSVQNFLVEIFNFISFQAPIFIASKVIGISASGTISVFNRITAIPGDIIQQGISKVLFPVFTRLNQRSENENLLLWSVWINSILLLPMLVGLSILSFPITTVLLGPNFSPYAVVFCYLALSRAVTSPCAGMNPYLKGIGKINILLLIFFARSILVISLGCLFSLSHGFKGLAFSLVISSILTSIMMFCVVSSVSHLPFTAFLKIIIRPLLAVFFMVVVTLLFNNFITVNVYLQLFLSSFVCVSSYFIALIFLYPPIRVLRNFYMVKEFFTKTWIL